MSERRKKGAATNKFIAYAGAAAIHAVVIGIMVFNFTQDDPTETVDAFDAEKIDLVKARAVDEDQLAKTREEIKQKELAKKQARDDEEKRLRELKQQAELEKQRLAKLEEQNKTAQEQERERVIALNKKKKEEELEEQKRQEQQQRDADKKRQELAKLAKQKAEQEAELKRIKEQRDQLEAKQRKREQEELTRRLLAEEEQRRAAAEQRAAAQRTTTAQNKAVARIGQKISQAFRVDPSLSKDLMSVVSIKVSPSGNVESVRTIVSSGDSNFDESGERAVLLASPLEIPTEEEDSIARARFLEQEFQFELFHPFARR